MKSTIVVRTNKRPNLLKQSLLSVENQTSRNWEIIIFDDSGLIENLEIVNNFRNRNNDNRVIYLSSSEPFYFFRKSWELMFDLSEGDIIIRLDDDDLLSKYTVEYLTYIYSKYEDLDFTYGSSLSFMDNQILGITQTRTPLEIPKTQHAWIPYTIENNSPWNNPNMYQNFYYDEPQHYTSIIHASKLNEFCIYHTYSIRKSSITKIRGKFKITSKFVDDLEFLGTIEYFGLKHTSLKKVLTYVRNHDLGRVTDNSEIRNDVEIIRNKVDFHRPNDFVSNILILNPEDIHNMEINDELVNDFKEVYEYCLGH